MAEPLTEGELAEVIERFTQFWEKPREERTRFLGFVSSQRCNDAAANELFDRFCSGEIAEENRMRLVAHLTQCAACHAAFLRLVWLSTDVDGH